MWPLNVMVVIGLVAMVMQARMAGPLVIGHRGASGHRPEHTLESYALAIDMGAAAIEPDLVATKDGVLIARHENEIGGTTDVAAKFPARQTTKTIDGKPVTGWFAEDFTIDEIRTLRARERLEFRSHAFDGQFEIPTFEAVLDLAVRRSRELGREIAIYPETKHPTYFRSIGLPLEERLLEALARRGFTAKASPVFVQSFEPSSLQYLRPRTAVRLVQLLDQQARPTPDRLRAIAAWADGVGLHKELVIPVGQDGTPGAPTSVVRDAHDAGLFVHVWTLRRDPQFLPAGYGGDAAREVADFLDLGVDGFFTDFPDVGAAVVRARRP